MTKIKKHKKGLKKIIIDEFEEREAREMKKSSKKPGMKSRNMEILMGALIPLLMGFIIYTQFFRPSEVIGTSMYPTFDDGDKLWGTPYKPSMESDLQRGDVVGIYSEELGLKLIKRIIGLPGDRIEIKSLLDRETGYYRQGVWINGEYLKESYTKRLVTEKPLERQTFEVPEGHVFVLGDNRPYSIDSRTLEQPYLPISQIKEVVRGQLPDWVPNLRKLFH